MGVFWAIVAGVGFGFFQAFNRKAGVGIDPYRGTFILLLISALILVAASFVQEDLGMLAAAPLSAYLNFAMAGLVHFFIGWTLISLSQNQVGAARTGALVGATPLFAAVVAALTLGEILDLWTILGILLVVGGVYLVSNE
ncbi:MAG TPA: DMT family transporter [Anaerolineales bacterium]|nr:DMT family transporter [Anaerolineales bacterium]